jgi:hypothetical protein
LQFLIGVEWAVDEEVIIDMLDFLGIFENLRKGLACFGLLISVVWIFDEGLLFVLGS